MFAGNDNDGPLVGTNASTMTLNVPIVTCPCWFVNLHETPVVPTAKRLPDGGVQSAPRVRPFSSSPYVAMLNVTTAPFGLVACTVMSGSVCGEGGGGGGASSKTSTTKESLAELPRESLALQFTVVEPTANVEPDAGEHATLTEPSTRSFADAEY